MITTTLLPSIVRMMRGGGGDESDTSKENIVGVRAREGRVTRQGRKGVSSEQGAETTRYTLRIVSIARITIQCVTSSVYSLSHSFTTLNNTLQLRLGLRGAGKTVAKEITTNAVAQESSQERKQQFRQVDAILFSFIRQ